MHDYIMVVGNFPSFHFHIYLYLFFFCSCFVSHDVRQLIFILFRLCSCEFMCIWMSWAMAPNDEWMWRMRIWCDSAPLPFHQVSRYFSVRVVHIKKETSQKKTTIVIANKSKAVRLWTTSKSRKEEEKKLKTRNEYCGFFTNYLILITIN